MKKTLKQFCAPLLFLFLFASASRAQQTVSGTVKDEKGEPLIGVSVVVKGTTIGSSTNTDGQYNIRMPADANKLVFSYVGYSTQEKEVSGSTLDITLSEKASQLDEVVVTGLATSIKRSNAANAVSQISSRELTGTTIQSTVDGAMYGKLAGANISSSTGAPGGGISVKLRGITTLVGNSQPLYIVDGIYYDNSSVPAGLNTVSKAANQGSASNQDNPSNRIADLNPQDIDKIEVLKGASAAAIYGSRAAAGVIIITTKRGRNSGSKPQVSLSQSVGMQMQLHKLGQRDWNDSNVLKSFGQPGLDYYISHGRQTYDYENELYGNKGMMYTTNIGVSGGNENTAYYSGFTRNDDEGIVKHSGYEKSSFRLNVDQRVSSFMDLSLNSNYVSSSANRGYFGNDNTSTTMGVSFVSTPSFAQLHPDAFGNYPDNPFAPSNFLQTRDLITNNEKVNRLLTGGKLTTRLITKEKQSLQLLLSGGIDYFNLKTTAIFPTTLQFEANGNNTSGFSGQGFTENKASNISAVLVHSYYTTSGLIFRTQVGLTQEKLNQTSIINSGTFLLGTQTNVDQAGSIQAEENRIIQTDRGFFAQEEVNLHDMIIATVGLRGDKSSRNGDANKLYYYPKASLAININEIGSLKSNPDMMISTLKPRVAYGESGNFAVFGSIYNPLTPAVFNGTTGSLIGTTRGKTDISPERQKEIEAGFDLGLFKNKILLDFTWYKKDIDDLLFNIETSTSTGWTFKWANIGAIENKGLEIGLDVNPVSGKDFKWNAHFAWWKNKALITRLDVPAFNTGAFGATLGTYRIEEGKSPTQIVGIGPSDKDPDGDGLVVWGNGEPDFQLSWANTLTYKNWELSFMFHWKKGGDNINLSTLLSDIFGTSPDYDKMSLDPDGKLNNGDYRLSQLGVSAGVFVEDASYLRLREAGLAYNMPKKWFKNKAAVKVGISGRNLINIFDYNSYDPEVSNFGVGAISSNVEVTPYPTAKSAFFTLSVIF